MITSINPDSYPSMAALRDKYKAEGFEANLARDAFNKVQLVVVTGQGDRLEFATYTEDEAKQQLDAIAGADMLRPI